VQTKSSSKYILAYDATCGPCTKFKRIVDILDKYERIDFISLTKADEEGLLDKISVHQRLTKFLNGVFDISIDAISCTKLLTLN
jgi:predicted DCC family thiol-disulfide oxidoreductase YuxK